MCVRQVGLVAFPLLLGLGLNFSAYLFELLLVNIILIQTIGCYKFFFDHVEYFWPYSVEPLFLVCYCAALVVEHPRDRQITRTCDVGDGFVVPPRCFGSHGQLLVVDLHHAACVDVGFGQFVAELLLVLETVAQLLLALDACVCYHAHLA